MTIMKRRDFLKNLGLVTAGVAAGSIVPDNVAHAAGLPTFDDPNPSEPVPGSLNDVTLPIRSLEPKVDHTVTVVMVGAGSRGNVYGNYALKFPGKVKFVGVSDINPERKEAFARKHGIPKEHCFGDFHEILAVPKFADAMVIATPDDLHYEPCMKALDLGYDVLLEKPAAQTEKECRDILAQSRKYGHLVAVCHVLRYAPYFLAMREMIRKGAIGDLVSIQHLEPIQYEHMAHSYVRGNWRDSKQTTPIILAKSCHDLDIIRWIVDKPCQTIVADGSLYLFKEENAPEGAPARCTDGCPHERNCPYSAINIYQRKKGYLYVFDNLDKNDDEAILERLRTTGYGRCVYHCDNDQPDHYVTAITFEGGVTASFSMEAFSPRGGRRTRIMGTRGFIEGDNKSFTVSDFVTGKEETWNKEISEIPEYKGAGHGGGDHALMRDFVEAVAAQDPGRLSSTIEVSVESHVMGFAAEKSRKSGKKVKVKV